jgi:hypothetical protein
MNIGINVNGCLVCYNNLSSVAEDCPRGWTSMFIMMLLLEVSSTGLKK